MCVRDGPRRLSERVGMRRLTNSSSRTRITFCSPPDRFSSSFFFFSLLAIPKSHRRGFPSLPPPRPSHPWGTSLLRSLIARVKTVPSLFTRFFIFLYTLGPQYALRIAASVAPELDKILLRKRTSVRFLLYTSPIYTRLSFCLYTAPFQLFSPPVRLLDSVGVSRRRNLAKAEIGAPAKAALNRSSGVSTFISISRMRRVCIVTHRTQCNTLHNDIM